MLDDLAADPSLGLLGHRSSGAVRHAREYEASYQGMPERFGLLGGGTARGLGGDSRAAGHIGAADG